MKTSEDGSARPIERLLEPDFDPQWRPPEIQTMGGERVSANEFLGGLLVIRRLARKQAEVGAPLPEAEPPLPTQVPSLHSLTAIVKADRNKAWIATESFEDVIRGQLVDVDPATDLQLGPVTGLVACRDGWLKVELIAKSEVDSFKKERGLYPSGSPIDQPEEPGTKGDAEILPDEGDARTLYVDFDEEGHRYKSWRRVCQESKEYSFSDSPHEGPSTVLFLIKQMERNGGNPKLWLDLWCRARGIAENDRAKHELRCLCEALYHAGTVDCLNVASLACMETLSRRIQSVVDAYSVATGSNPDWSNAKLFTNYQSPEDIRAPQLKSWAARRGKEELELHNARNRMKELRKQGQPALDAEAAGAIAEGALPATCRRTWRSTSPWRPWTSP